MSDAMYLHVQAERCFRLANGPAGPRLADELEALGRALECEAMKLEVASKRQRGASQALLGVEAAQPSAPTRALANRKQVGFTANGSGLVNIVKTVLGCGSGARIESG